MLSSIMFAIKWSKSGIVMISDLFCFCYDIALAVQDLLRFHMNFSITFSYLRRMLVFQWHHIGFPNCFEQYECLNEEKKWKWGNSEDS